MSSIFQTVFGGEQQKSAQTSTANSSNQAYPYLQQTFSPVAQGAAGANSQVSSLLGLNGQSGQNEAFNNYKASAGYQNGLDTGSHAVTDNMASKGLLRSGATGEALAAYGQNYANNFLNQYLQNANNVTSQGLAAGNTISGAGNVYNQQSTGTSSGSKKPGLTSLIGAFL
jgi:hypothetical protein